ncbi:hypothetical protein HPP92_000108 [Vanilla planifolia]|uniref:Putative E3 ubiquitin-protein ligase LIN N-terminal domain-containing protein n=1 Tax=Vanilla planifolia TaxID=51239 RepID=A0A835S0M9_VANPL|nr:hypothetical protein HPP92_000108 [Vanilla planifolia]
MATPPTHPDPNEELSYTTISAVVAVVDNHFCHLLSSPAPRRSILLRCTSKLTIPSIGLFQFDDHSVLSNLYWGIETIESAINVGSTGDRNARLANAERMLQVPAMLDEGAATAGIENRYIVCCSYFHLSLIRKLLGDEWQMAMHLFQAVLVSPSIVRADLAPELCENLFGIPEFIGASEEAERQRARRYKDLLMYYQVMSYGESRNKKFKSFPTIQFCESIKQDYATAMFQGVSMPNTLHQNSTAGRKNSMVYESNSEGKEPSTKLDDETSSSKYLDEDSDKHRMKVSFDIRRLQEMLEESQSDSSISVHSDLSEASDSEFLSLSRRKNKGIQGNGISDNGILSASQMTDRNYSPKSSPPMSTASCEATDTKYGLSIVGYGTAASRALADKYDTSVFNHNLSTLDSKVVDSNSYFDLRSGGENPTMTSKRKDVRCFRSFSSKFRKKHDFSDIVHHGSFARKMTNIFSSEKDWSEESCNYEKICTFNFCKGLKR